MIWVALAGCIPAILNPAAGPTVHGWSWATGSLSVTGPLSLFLLSMIPIAIIPSYRDAPLFKGLAAPELAQDDASFGLKCSRRIGSRQLIVLISFEAPYTWQDVYDFLNSVKES